MGDMDNDGPGAEKIIIYMYGVQEHHHRFELLSLHMPTPIPKK